MPRETLDKRIKQLKEEILLLDSQVENAVRDAVEALKYQDLRLARTVSENDRFINEKRYLLETNCIATIATQQPLAGHDLRLLASILEVAAELERMGDYAKGIARICLMIDRQPLVKPLIDIPRMMDHSLNMLHRAVWAFVEGDVELARDIPKEDDEVDRLYNQVYHDLIAIIIANPEALDQSTHLMWAAHNLERLADRVTNICERTIYAVTGKIKEIKSSDDEMQGTDEKKS
jgi:phosphate transport system protein